MSKVAQATTQAIQNGANPSLLSALHSILGSQAYNGLCEKFVEQATQGKSGLYGTAINAWDQQQNKVMDPSLNGIQPGDAIYFNADSSNGDDGHTGVYVGNGQFISATDDGVKQTDLGSWLNSTGQQILGYIPGKGQMQNIASNMSNMASNVGNSIGGAIGGIGQDISQAFNPVKPLPATIPQYTPSIGTPTYNPVQISPNQSQPLQKQPQQTIASAAFGGNYG